MSEENYIDIELKNAIERGDIIGPRILASGIGIVSANGHGAAHTVCDGEEEILKQIRKNFAQGADHVKLFVTGGISSPESTLELSSYSKEEILTAVKEAQRAGSYVGAHAHGGVGMDLCIECGVRTLEHAAYINNKQLDKVIEKDLWIIGTFSILFHPEGIEKNDLKNDKIKAKVIKAREFIQNNFRDILKSEVNFALGTDSMHGLIGEEIKFVNNLGLDNYDAIKAATIKSAEACMVDEYLGSIESNKIADFIVLEGDPLVDINNITNIKAVYKNGKKVREVSQ